MSLQERWKNMRQLWSDTKLVPRRVALLMLAFALIPVRVKQYAVQFIKSSIWQSHKAILKQSQLSLCLLILQFLEFLSAWFLGCIFCWYFLPCLHFYFKLLHFLTLQKCIFSHTCYFQEQARKGPTQNTPIGCQTTTSALQRHRFSHLTSLAFGISFLEMSLYLCVLFFYLIISSSHHIWSHIVSSHLMSCRLVFPCLSFFQLISSQLFPALLSSSHLFWTLLSSSARLSSSQLPSALRSSYQLYLLLSLALLLSKTCFKTGSRRRSQN